MISGLRADAFVESPHAGLGFTVRKAVMHDIPPILQLINGYAARGIMLSRTEFEMSEAIRDFSVITRGPDLLGCGALHFYSPTMGEIRSLAVDEQAKTHGVGRRIVEALVREAVQYELDAVFAFTYVDEFFRKVGFQYRRTWRAPPQSLEGLRALPQISGLRRNRRPAHSPSRALGRGATGPMGPFLRIARRPVHPDPGSAPADLGAYPQSRVFQHPAKDRGNNRQAQFFRV